MPTPTPSGRSRTPPSRREEYLDAGWPDVFVIPRGDYFPSWENRKAPKRKGGRVYIHVRESGEVDVFEGYVTAKEAKRLDTGEVLDTGPKTPRPEVTSTCQTYIDLHRHAAVRVALCEHSKVALRLMVAHAIAGSPLWTVKIEEQASRNEAVRESVETCRAETAFDTKRRAVLDLLGFSPEEPTVTGGNGDGYGLVGIFLRLLDLPDRAVMDVITIVIGETLAAGSAAVEAVGGEIGVDMASYWQADDVFFECLRDKEVLTRIVAEIAGEEVAAANAKEKGATLKKIVRDHLEGSNGRAKVEGWVPKWMAFPPSAYTARGGIGTVAAHAKVVVARAVTHEPDSHIIVRGKDERGDIIRTMQRSYAARGNTPALVDQAIYDPAADARPLTGRVVHRGLADEIADRHYVIVEATDGRSHYVDIGKGENVESHAPGAIVRIVPVEAAVRASDRTAAEVAAANDGRYSIDAHLRHDPAATEAFAETHVRRLEAMRRLTRNVKRDPDGSWVIAPDHLDCAAAYENARAKDRPVSVETLSPLPLEKLVDAEAATWLDRELVASAPEPLRDTGFGHDVREAQARRRQWLVAEGLAEERAGQFSYRSGVIAALQRRELLRVASGLSGELGLSFAEVKTGERIDGIYRRPVDTMSGRYALVERSRDFTLVPWRPVLDRYVGKSVSSIMRDGRISWTLGRQRGGPSIS